MVSRSPASGTSPNASRRPRPGRPQRFDKAEVLDNALALFWKKGFANTTTRELETELSLNQSSMYNTFGSKEGLFNAVMDRYEVISTEALVHPLEQTENGIAALNNFFESLKEWVTYDGRRGCMIINMMAEDGGSNPAISARTANYRMRVKKALRGALERATRDGVLTAGDIDARAMLLFGLALGLNIAARGCTSNQELNQLAAAVQEQIKSWQVPIHQRVSGSPKTAP